MENYCLGNRLAVSTNFPFLSYNDKKVKIIITIIFRERALLVYRKRIKGKMENRNIQSLKLVKYKLVRVHCEL